MKSDSECYLPAYSLEWPRHPLGVVVNWPQNLPSTLSITQSGSGKRNKPRDLVKRYGAKPRMDV